MFGREQRVDDGAGVVAFEPTVGGDGAAAGAVAAGVHHDDAVAGGQQKFRLADDADAVVCLAVEEEDPVPVWIFGADFPAVEQHSIRRADVEILAGRPTEGEGSIGFADEVGRKFAADRMEERRAGEPSGHSRQERREEQ